MHIRELVGRPHESGHRHEFKERIHVYEGANYAYEVLDKCGSFSIFFEIWCESPGYAGTMYIDWA